MDEGATKSDDGGAPESRPLLGDNKRTTDDISTSKCRLPIEPIPTFILLAIGLQNPILKEFLYYKQCEKNNITFVWDNNSSKCFLNMSDPGYMAQQTAQALASQQLLYHNIALYIPVCFSAIFFGVWSDLSQRRKVAILPAIFGCIIQATLYLLLMGFKFSFEFVIIGIAFVGLFGYMYTPFVGIKAYLADVTPRSKLTFRLAVLSAFEGMGIGLGFVTSGLWIQWQRSFTTSMWIPLGLFAFIFLYVLLLPESLPGSKKKLFSCSYFGAFGRACSSAKNSKINWSLLGCYYVAYISTHFADGAFSEIVNLYLMDSPFCWDPTKIGILLAAMYLGGHMMSAVGIRLFGSVMDDLWIAQIGVLSDVLANILMAVSAYLPHRDMVPFIVPCVRMFGRMQHSVISSGMSKLVPQDRQGTVFALLYCFEAINKLTQSLVFLPVYRATLHWFPGFGFLINPAINFAITAPVLGFVHYRTRCRSMESKLTIN
ncbi:proton-coupled folate transporter-like [Branchiostoma lanceolatum]|uniref:proton-coupled folate transporter-like n=1 Tax=Branchiostoma lanceolatum TaxID=7740 RepID=UPI00345234B1